MRVLMVSKAMVVGTYQRKLEELAALSGVELLLVTPSEWRESSRTLRYEPLFRHGYRTVLLPMALNGHFHLHFYRGLGPVIRDWRPDLIHLDEEPADVVAAQTVSLAGPARLVFFTWQNLLRRVPLPFSVIQRRTFDRADLALCGNIDAVGVLRAKGYAGPTRVVPQFGVDPELFPFRPRQAAEDGLLRIGVAGRLVHNKGVHLLIAAAARLTRPWALEIAGEGPEGAALRRQVAGLGLAGRVRFLGQRPSSEMPALLARWDVAAMPSLTFPNWKEQFGRAAMEAMSCGTPVVVARSGELPHVVDRAGLIFPEGNVAALTQCLEQLAASPALRMSLAEAGRQRVLAHYTQRAVAVATYAAYRDALEGCP